MTKRPMIKAARLLIRQMPIPTQKMILHKIMEFLLPRDEQSLPADNEPKIAPIGRIPTMTPI